MITPDDLLNVPFFQSLSRALLVRVSARAADIHVNRDEWIAHDGDPAYFWALLDGEVEGVKLIAGEHQQVTTFDPGEYFGEVPLMLSTAAFIGVRALKPSRLARIDPNDFHSIVAESPEAGALLALTLTRRVSFMRDAYASATLTQATIVGYRYDFACHDIRDFLFRNQVGFEWLDPSDANDQPCIPDSVMEAARYPAVVLTDGTILEAPTLRQIAIALKLQTEPERDEYDVAIVGGGPAGLAAAVYGGSEGLRSIMIECEAPGGQAGTSSRIENYLGFPGGVSGSDLANRALLQAKRFGTEILVTRSADALEATPDGHVVVLDGGARVRARAVVLATGVAWRKLESEGAERLVGRGVFYGAARTEALGTSGKNVFLIGGGNSAGQAAMFFSNYARSVTLLIRGTALEKSMSYYLIQQLKTKANITVETETTVTRVGGDEHLDTIVTKNEGTAATMERPADALFAFIGADAETSWLPEQIERDARGYVRTGHEIAEWRLTRPAYALETSVPGIFAAGDVRSNSVKRVASGVGEGSMVIAFVHEYLATLGVPVA
ncbi:MAG: FAD-dependent oxidoreductase [Candidatus Eremiobacteraeota bacterium]|nr:FAD-dependent oxidoreductase [Candidatus Eremiobacteraeota bacterium]